MSDDKRLDWFPYVVLFAVVSGLFVAFGTCAQENVDSCGEALSVCVASDGAWCKHVDELCGEDRKGR